MLPRRERPDSFVHINCEDCGSTLNLLRNKVYENIKCESCIEKLFEKLNKEKENEQ